MAGAIASSILAVRIFDVNVPLGYWYALSASVWIIYLTDHLSDSFFLATKGNIEKQQFFAQNARTIRFAIIVLASFILIDLYFLHFSIIIYGAIGGTIIFAYLFLNQFQSIRNIYLFPRELVTATFYTYGTWGVPFMLNHFNISPDTILYIIGFWLLALANLLIYSYFDFEDDERQQVQTLAVRISQKVCLWLSIIFLMLALIIYVLLAVAKGIELKFVLVGIVMDLILLQILIFRGFYVKNHKFGIIADLVFLVPFVLIFL